MWVGLARPMYVFVWINQKVTFEITKTATQHWKSLKSILCMMFFNAIFSGKILPIRTGPQFAFSLMTLMMMMKLWRDLTQVLTPKWSRKVGAVGVWGPGVQHWQRCQVNAGLSLVNTANTRRWLVRFCQIRSRAFDQCQEAKTSGDTVLAN